MKISIQVPSPTITSVWDQCIKNRKNYAIGDPAEPCYTVDVQMARGFCPALKTFQRVVHQVLNSVRFIFVVVALNYFQTLFFILFISVISDTVEAKLLQVDEGGRYKSLSL